MRFALKLTVFTLAATLAFAGTDTSDMTVQASVSANCTISAPTLDFGAYDPIVTNAGTAHLDTTADLTVQCTQGSSATITLSGGDNNTGTEAAPARRLNTGSEYLTYNLYTTSGRTTAWDGVTGVGYTGQGTSSTVTVYGRVDGGQTGANAGSYTDTVTATVTF